MNMLARIAATGLVAAIAVPASAVTTVVTSAVSTASVNTGTLANSNLTAIYSAGSSVVLVPRLSLATRQTITKVTIELLIGTTTTGKLTNGTGDRSPRTYRLANSFSGTLSGALPTGTNLVVNPAFTSETNSVQASGGQTVAVNFGSGPAQVVSTTVLTAGNLNLFNANPYIAAPFDEVFRMVLAVNGTSVASRPRDSSGVVPSGNIGSFNRVLTTFINTSTRVTYESRDWIPGDPPVPEPATWMTMIAGFGLVGAMMRRRRIAGIATR